MTHNMGMSITSGLYPTIHLAQCPICDWPTMRFFESQVDKLWINDKYEIIRVEYDVCEACGTVFQNPRPTNEWIGEYYSNGTYRATIQDGNPNVTQRVINEQVLRARYIIEYTKEYKPRKVLDVGSSAGMLLMGARAELGCEVMGVEAEGPFRDFCEEREIPVCDDLDCAGDGYDIVYCIHTLEHIPDPVGALKAMSKAAKRVVVEVPDLRNYTILRLAHLYAWTQASLYHTLSLAGLTLKAGLVHGNEGLDDEQPENILVVCE